MFRPLPNPGEHGEGGNKKAHRVVTDSVPFLCVAIAVAPQQFDSLLGKLDAIVRSNEANAVAENTRSEALLATLATLKSMIEAQGVIGSQSMDLNVIQGISTI